MSRTTTIVLLVLLAALAGYVLLVQVPRDQAAAQATATPNPFSAQYLWALTVDQVAAVRVEDRAGGRSVAFRKDATGAWAVTEPVAGPADALAAADAASQVTQLSVAATLTDTTDLAPFGVLSPTHTLEVRLTDGTELSANVGITTPVGGGYYVLRAGEPYAVVVSGFALERVLGLLDAPPVPPTATPGFALPTGAPGVTATP
jgi:hypothetical protein